ncbi:MAG: tRNA (adenosine(37)-N6)-threonylcarbamoyltransferase complex ATPase subunit type 1 TsaE [Chromatiales bacterium]|nr:tRNA (adenosine(37)-N6)-threonylcarbamoyltransferase complex ATPase subunit type 1 TsaE [Chromatiales bacterium]
MAKRSGRGLKPGCLIFLRGDLGAGKTTFVRGCLRASGFTGSVKSPTFTIVEEYQLDQHTPYHFDLYRLAELEELEWLGIRDYLRPDSICFVEWPERGAGILPTPDLELTIPIVGLSRTLEIKALTAEGQAVVETLDHGS